MNTLPGWISSLLALFWSFNFTVADLPVSTTYQDQHKNVSVFDTTHKTIHVFVALCDNKYQGIVPVPAKIGNGQDPDNNLYWGCGYGVRSFFKNSKEWKFIKRQKLDSITMERLVFKHPTYQKCSEKAARNLLVTGF